MRAMVLLGLLLGAGIATPSELGVEAAAVMKEIRARVPALASCTKKTHGKAAVVVRFSVSAAGAVANARTDGSTFTGPEVPACVERAVAAWTFRGVASPADFALPLRFAGRVTLEEPKPDRPGTMMQMIAPVGDPTPPPSGQPLAIADMQAVIRKEANGVRRCYQAGLQRNPKLAGKVVLDLQIAASGEVTFAAARASSLRDDVAAQCMADKARAWKFPPSSATTTTTFPFSFVAQP